MAIKKLRLSLTPFQWNLFQAAGIESGTATETATQPDESVELKKLIEELETKLNNLKIELSQIIQTTPESKAAPLVPKNEGGRRKELEETKKRQEEAARDRRAEAKESAKSGKSIIKEKKKGFFSRTLVELLKTNIFTGEIEEQAIRADRLLIGLAGGVAGIAGAGALGVGSVAGLFTGGMAGAGTLGYGRQKIEDSIPKKVKKEESTKNLPSNEKVKAVSDFGKKEEVNPEAAEVNPEAAREKAIKREKEIKDLLGKLESGGYEVTLENDKILKYDKVKNNYVIIDKEGKIIETTKERLEDLFDGDPKNIQLYQDNLTSINNLSKPEATEFTPKRVLKNLFVFEKTLNGTAEEPEYSYDQEVFDSKTFEREQLLDKITQVFDYFVKDEMVQKYEYKIADAIRNMIKESDEMKMAIYEEDNGISNQTDLNRVLNLDINSGLKLVNELKKIVQSLNTQHLSQIINKMKADIANLKSEYEGIVKEAEEEISKLNESKETIEIFNGFDNTKKGDILREVQKKLREPNYYSSYYTEIEKVVIDAVRSKNREIDTSDWERLNNKQRIELARMIKEKSEK